MDRLDAVVSLTVVTILTFQLSLLLQWTKEDGHRTPASAVPNLFVPLNTNPKEVQEMRNKVCTDCHQQSVEADVRVGGGSPGWGRRPAAAGGEGVAPGGPLLPPRDCRGPPFTLLCCRADEVQWQCVSSRRFGPRC